MKTARKVTLLMGFAVLILLSTGVAAQDQATITLNEVKTRLSENQRFLKEAAKRGKAGDTRGMEVALENYQRGSEGLDRALSRGRFDGNVFEREEAFERVEKATRKNGEVLTDLLGKVPEQARPAIEHARQVSQRGRETALANLQQARVNRQAAEQRGESRRPADVGAARGGQAGGATARRPSGIGAGKPGGVGGGKPGGPPSKRP